MERKGTPALLGPGLNRQRRCHSTIILEAKLCTTRVSCETLHLLPMLLPGAGGCPLCPLTQNSAEFSLFCTVNSGAWIEVEDGRQRRGPQPSREHGELDRRHPPPSRLKLSPLPARGRRHEGYGSGPRRRGGCPLSRPSHVPYAATEMHYIRDARHSKSQRRIRHARGLTLQAPSNHTQ